MKDLIERLNKNKFIYKIDSEPYKTLEEAINILDKYRWRDVKEELPEANQDCIGRWWAGGVEKFYLTEDGDCYYQDKMVGSKKANVMPTHWMPMPEFGEVEK